MKKILLALTIALLALPGSLLAKDDLAEVKQLQIVKSIFPPQMEILEAKDMGSLYEVVVKEPSGKQIYYLTKDGLYLVVGGNLVDKNKVNLTQKRMDDVTRVDFAKLPLKDALVIKKGDGHKKLVMFTDIDCPFCQKAYDWLKNQTNYTLYVFLDPLPMHPKSPEKSVEVFCSKNHETAFDLAQTGKEIGGSKCEAGEKMLDRHKAISGEVGVDGTPLFVTDAGLRIKGLQIPSLESYLKN